MARVPDEQPTLFIERAEREDASVTSDVPDVPDGPVDFVASHLPGDSPKLAVELRRGSRRRRHVEGVLHGDTLIVSYPPRMSERDASRIGEELRVRMERRVARERIDLAARARRLAREYGLPRPKRVEWSDRQHGRWGSCTPADGAIRVSSRLARCPTWVLDYVLVHELAHLRWADHGSEFQAAIASYPRAERATGFLAALDLFPSGLD